MNHRLRNSFCGNCKFCSEFFSFFLFFFFNFLFISSMNARDLLAQFNRMAGTFGLQNQMLFPQHRVRETKLQVRLLAYSEAFLAKTELKLSAGDKVILPPTILQSLLNMYGEDELPYPTIFQIKSQHKVSHCGVLEYSSLDENAVYMPAWMMQNLLISDGDEVDLNLIKLPKVRFVKFQPDFYAFTQIPDPKVTLEYALRNYTCLTLGDCISLEYNHTQHPITVTHLEYEGPPVDALANFPAGCVIDSNLEVDFDPPCENAPEKVFSVLSLGDVIVESLAKSNFLYYHVKISGGKTLLIKLKLLRGTPVAYVSTEVDEPNSEHNTWRLIGSPNKPAVLSIARTHPSYSAYFYVAINAFDVDSEFELCVESDEEKMNESVSGSGYVIRQANELSVSDPNYSICDNCKQPISSAAMMIHGAQCHRNNWYCAECLCVLPKKSKDSHSHCPICKIGYDLSEAEKHHALFHKKIRCECGIEFEHDVLPLHKSEECKFRKVNCKWCNLLVSHAELDAHQSYCANRSIECIYCATMVTRKQMDIHLAAIHRINPCLDDRGNRKTKKEVAVSNLASNEPQLCSDDEDMAAALAMSMEDCGKASLRPSVISIDEDMEVDHAWDEPELENDLQKALRDSLSYSTTAILPSHSMQSQSVQSHPIDLTENFECPICQILFANQRELQTHVDICSIALD